MSGGAPAAPPADGPPPVLTAALLREAALRAVALAVLYAGLVGLLVVLPERSFLHPAPVLLHGALVGLLAGPAACLEAALARHGPASPARLTVMLLVGILAFAGSGLAWTQAHYTLATLGSGSLEAGLDVVGRGGGLLSRKTHVAVALLVAPAVSLGLASAMATSRDLGRVRSLLVAGLAGLALGTGFFGDAAGLHLLAFMTLAPPAAVGAAIAARAVTGWWSRRGTDRLP